MSRTSDSRVPHANRSAWMRRVGTPSAGTIVTAGRLYMIGLDPLTQGVLSGSTLFGTSIPPRLMLARLIPNPVVGASVETGFASVVRPPLR